MEAIIFDLFETLVTPRSHDVVRPTQSIAERLNVGESNYSKFWPDLNDEWDRGNIVSYQGVLTHLCSQSGVEPNTSEIEDIVAEFRAHILKIFTRIDPAIEEMLKNLKKLGFRLGVVTNAANLDTEGWDECTIARYFDVFVASHEVGLIKPEIGIYLLACEQLKVDPSDAIFVGDGGSNELHGAKEAGLTPYWWTWFLDMYPDGVTPHTFVGGEWRERPRDGRSPYTVITNPDMLISEIT